MTRSTTLSGSAVRADRAVRGEAAAVPEELITALASGQVPRDAALPLLRTHLGQFQGQVQEGFEAHQISGLAAARWLASLTDGMMLAIHAYALAMVPAKNPAEAAEPAKNAVISPPKSQPPGRVLVGHRSNSLLNNILRLFFPRSQRP
jgi:[protein-PII] uridylyltransferase